MKSSGCMLVTSIIANALLAQSFELTFYGEPSCTGKPLGPQVQLNLPLQSLHFKNPKGDENCHKDYQNLAAGYQVTSTGDDEKQKMIVFYEDDACTVGYEVAISNAPFCIAGLFGSFAIKDVLNDKLNEAYFQGSGLQATQSDVTVSPSATATLHPTIHRVNTTASTATPAPVARKRGLRHSTAGADNSQFHHGSTYVHDGQTYKMHQVARGVYRGIMPADWDDSTHVKDDTELDVSDKTRSRAPTSASRSTSKASNRLSKKSIVNGCSAQLQCAYWDEASPLNVPEHINEWFNAAYSSMHGLGKRDRTDDTHLWDYLNQPFVIAMIDETGATVGHVTGRTQKAPGYIGQCYSFEGEADMLGVPTSGPEEAVMRTIARLGTADGPEGKSIYASELAGLIYLPDGSSAYLAMAAVESDTKQLDFTSRRICGGPSPA